MKQNRGRTRAVRVTGTLLAIAWAGVISSAQARPWLDVGDGNLRSDVEILAAYGLIDGPVTDWPLPSGEFARLGDESALANQSAYVQAAAARVRRAVQAKGTDLVAEARLSSRPSVIRGFDTLARDQADVRAGLDWDGAAIEGAVRVGALVDTADGDTDVALDGSYMSARFGKLRAYAGWVEQWSGPGWVSSLILSNNARPFPKLGLMRDDPRPFESRWLRWLGPWQAHLYVGYLDDQRIDDDTAFGSLRLTIEPLPGLELAAMRSVEFCGRGHKCNPFNAAFHLYNDDQRVNSTNDEATLEFKYSHAWGAGTISPYFQMMNEDTGPFTHSYTSYLGGLTLAGPWRDRGAHWRLTAEYTDTVATLNAFDFGTPVHGIAYGNAGYPDGFRYRDRTLGFSLDSDSRLASLDLRLIGDRGRSYSIALHRARISTPQLAAIQAAGDETAFHNTVSAMPLTFTECDLGVSVPVRGVALHLLLRARSRDLPDGLGDRLQAELGLRFRY